MAVEAQTAPVITRDASTRFLALDGSGSLGRVALDVDGAQHLFIPAGAMIPHQTNGPARGITFNATNLQPVESLDFDSTTQEAAAVLLWLPKRWNLGTLTFAPAWTAASGSGGVVWQADAVAVSNDDALDAAYGTGQTSTDTLLATGDLHIGPTSAAITPGGTPADADMMWLRISRVVADASDTLAADARLLGVRLTWTAARGNDA